MVKQTWLTNHYTSSRRRLGGNSLLRESEHPCGLGKSGHRKFAEIAPAARADAGKALRRHHGAVQPSGQLFQPRRQIDRRPDAGEVEPVAAADIAVEDSPEVKRDAEAETLDAAIDRILQRLDAGPGLARSFEHAAADL